RSRKLLRRELQQNNVGAALEQKYAAEAVNLLRDLIDQALLVERGTEMGLSVEADVIKRLDRIREESGLKSLEDLERALAAQGADFQDYRQRIRDQILTQQVIQRQVAGRVLIDSEELRQYYAEHQEELKKPERIRLREILVSTEGYRQDQLPEREERVRELLAKIRRGEKFPELARTYSDAPTAEDGGELGYFEPEKLAPAIRETISHLREGGVCDPMRTPQGWLILELVEHVPEGIPPFEKVQNELMQKLYFDRVQPALRDFLSELRRESFVYVKTGYVDTGAVEEPAKPVRRGRRLRSLRGKK
ncbi:MAG: peptidylprolyl isomerase, partial [Terriglobia bacterium]